MVIAGDCGCLARFQYVNFLGRIRPSADAQLNLPDGSTSIAFLTSRVRAPLRNDWRKLSYLVEYLGVDRLHPLILLLCTLMVSEY